MSIPVIGSKPDSYYDSKEFYARSNHAAVDEWDILFDIEDLSDNASVRISKPDKLYGELSHEYVARELLYNEHTALIATASKKILLARRDRYSPLKSGECIAKDKKYPNDLVLSKDNTEKEGTPVLRWDYGSKTSQAGWELWLTGPLPGKRIGFAPWNDKQGIENLVKSMNNTDSLVVQSILMDSEVMSSFNARKEMITWYQSNLWKTPSLRAIRRVLVSNKLTTRLSSPIINYIGAVSINIENIDIPIAITISIPDLLKWVKEKEKTFSGVRSAHVEYDIDEEEVRRDAWVEKARQGFEQSMGFNLVDYPPMLTGQYQPNSVAGREWKQSYICLTKIPSEDWVKMVPLLRGGRWQAMKPNDFFTPWW